MSNSESKQADPLESIWSRIPKEERERIDRVCAYYAPAPGILLYDNDDDDADSRLDHYDMPPLTDGDCQVLFADLPLGS